jgi:2-polyprenyl-3-methyl-5-hydroxy-6-metoxy-1,4-benzoquinol methylase
LSGAFEMTTERSQFWDQSVARSGHTGYVDDRLFSYDQPVRLATVRSVIQRLHPAGLANRAVLDIGCGTGDFVALAADLGAAAVDGIDISPEVLAIAAERFLGDERVSLHCGTVVEKTTQRDGYDLITSITVLQHHVDDEELAAALVALRNAMKPTGRMIVLELAPPRLGVERHYSDGVPYLVERPPKTWYATFGSAGLRVISEPVMPQFGIASLRGINWLVGSLLGLWQSGADATGPDVDPSAPSASGPSPRMSLSRRLRRRALEWVRTSVLLFCYPLDHWFRLPLPAPRFRTYRVFVLGKE